MRDNEQAVVILIDALAPPQARRVLERIELTETVGALLADKSWRQRLRKTVEERGYEVRAVHLLHGEPGAHVGVTVAPVGVRKLAGKGKTTALAGRPIDQVLLSRPRATVRVRRRES